MFEGVNFGTEDSIESFVANFAEGAQRDSSIILLQSFLQCRVFLFIYDLKALPFVFSNPFQEHVLRVVDGFDVVVGFLIRPPQYFVCVISYLVDGDVLMIPSGFLVDLSGQAFGGTLQCFLITLGMGQQAADLVVTFTANHFDITLTLHEITIFMVKHTLREWNYFIIEESIFIIR